MIFTKKKLNSKKIWIVDLWSYKIKASICEISWQESKIIWYWEKRQDSSYFNLWEFSDIEWISENIKEALEKAEISAGYKIEEIIINFPFEEIFFCSKHLTYKRKIINTKITEEENIKILNKINSLSINSCIKEISFKSSYKKEDLKEIINNISNIKIDSIGTDSILNKTWENISFSLLNILIPISKYNLLHYIWNILNKKIIKIVPSEFSIIKLFDNIKDMVVIDLWNSHTSIVVKKDNNLIGVSKIPLWINDLIKKIRKNRNITKIDTINSIDEDIFSEEKEEFLSIFEDFLITGLEEIIHKEICPHNFFITGWWWNNFIKEYIKRTDLNKRSLKLLQKANIIETDSSIYKVPWNKQVTTNIISLAKIAPSIL